MHEKKVKKCKCGCGCFPDYVRLLAAARQPAETPGCQQMQQS